MAQLHRTYLIRLQGISGTRRPNLPRHAVAIGVVAALWTGASLAADEPSIQEGSTVGTMLEQIVVTATKQSRAELNQKVPVTISAFSKSQIESLHLTDIQNLAYSIPNTSFENPGTFKGTATFSIRGLGLNSSISSTAPAVGVFVNGVYLGVNQGVLVDTFDLEGIEVLRGPQGTLFGRNVTGGAVLLNNRKPSQTFDFESRSRVETGPEFNQAIAAGGPINDKISVRLAGIYDYDEGYFHDVTLNRKLGVSRQYVLRPSIRYESGAGTDIVIFGEHGKITGDGPLAIARDYTGGTLTANQSLFPAYGLSRNNYEDFVGRTDLEWNSITSTASQDVNFGEDGQIVNVFGWRKINNFSAFASDGTPLFVAHNQGFTGQNQYSEELRYNGGFGPFKVTAGGYFFHQYQQQFIRQLLANNTQGGQMTENVLAAFGQIDYKVLQRLTVQVGGRYSYEHKKADVSALSRDGTVGSLPASPGTFGVPGGCTLNPDVHFCNYQYAGLAHSWRSFTPKVSVKYEVTPDAQVYATWQKAFRSGGFNLRYNAASPPQAYDPERQTAIEVGFKSDLFDHRTRLNGALFYTKIRSLQRDLTQFLVFGTSVASVQSTFNSADATIKGAELELVQQIVPHLIFSATMGYVDAKYDRILLDITQDPAPGAVTSLDYAQKLPRVAPWTYSFNLTADHEFDFGKVTGQVAFSHRDDSFFVDFNTDRRDGAIPDLGAANILDAQMTYELPSSHLSFTVYGKNLTNDFTLAAFTPIAYPNLKGCSCTPNKGRVIGGEVNIRY